MIYGELVGGPGDGCRMNPDDPDEPFDWPDYFRIETKRTGAVGEYTIRSHTPTQRGHDTIFFFDWRRER